MPEEKRDPTERVTAPVGAPAPEAEGPFKEVTPEELLKDPKKLEEEIKRQIQQKPGETPTLPQVPGMIIVQVMGQLSLAMQLANSFVKTVNAAKRIGTEMATRLFGGLGIANFVRSPKTPMEAVHRIIQGETDVSPQQIQQLIDLNGTMQVLNASGEDVRRMFEQDAVRLIAYVTATQEKSQDVVNHFKVLRAEEVRQPDRPFAQEAVQNAERLMSALNKIIANQSAYHDLTTDELQGVSAYLDKIGPATIRKYDKIANDVATFTTRYGSAELIEKSSFVKQAQPVVEAPERVKTRVLNTPMSKDLQVILDGLENFIPAVDVFIAQARRLERLVEGGISVYKPLNELLDGFVETPTETA